MGAASQHRACIFCGSSERKISKEHLWAIWMRQHIDGGEGSPIGHSRTHEAAGGEVRTRDDFRDIPLNWQMSGPCEDCNGGWMDRVEASARSSLIPMMRNEPVKLDPVAQQAVARWVTLKVLIAQHGHPKVQPVPERRYERFHREREPFDDAQVWIGRYDGSGAWPTNYRHQELFVVPLGGPDPPTPNAYLVAFHVSYAAFVYFGHEVEHLAIESLGGLSRFLTPIWPAWGSAAWPPAGLLGADGLDAIFAGFPFS